MYGWDEDDEGSQWVVQGKEVLGGGWLRDSEGSQEEVGSTGGYSVGGLGADCKSVARKG